MLQLLTLTSILLEFEGVVDRHVIEGRVKESIVQSKRFITTDDASSLVCFLFLFFLHFDFCCNLN